jgi:hypothetical protein
MSQQLYPQYRALYELNLSLGGSQEPVWMFWRKNLLLFRFEPQAVQFLSSDSNYTVLEQGLKATYMYLLDDLC